MVEPNDCCLDGKGGLLIADVGDWPFAGSI
jgi:hypothetical protein